MVTLEETIDAIDRCIADLGGKCDSYLDRIKFLQDHNVDTSQFPLPFEYFSFEKLADDLIYKYELHDPYEDDLPPHPETVDDADVLTQLMKYSKELGGLFESGVDCIRFLRDHDFDFSKIELPKGCPSVDVYEEYLVEAEELDRKFAEEVDEMIRNNPNIICEYYR